MIAVTGDPLRNNAYVFAHRTDFWGYPDGQRRSNCRNWPY